MKNNGSTIVKLCIVAFLLMTIGCAKEDQIITYIYEEVGREVDGNGDNNQKLDEVIIQVSSRKPDAIRKLSFKQYFDTASLMETKNLTFSEAQTFLQERYDRTSAFVDSWGELALDCIDCDVHVGSESKDAFIHISRSNIEQSDNITPHVGYWQRTDFDFTQKSFDITNSSVQEILKEYRLTNTYQERKKVMSIQLLMEDASFPWFEFFIIAHKLQENEDGLETVISEGQPAIYKRRDIPTYDFMKAPWFALNFEGTEFHSRDDYDNVVVPWEYCIEGTYQEQRTGYWSACSRVSRRIYDMFGNYQNNLPEQSMLSYKLVSSGYYVKEGILPKADFLALLDSAAWTAEIPTPFTLNTFWIGNGFDGIVFREIRKDGMEWEYSIDKADDSGFYLRVQMIKDNKRDDQSFTFFESKSFDGLYQRLLK